MSKDRLLSSADLSFDEASEAWEALSEYVADFLEAWEVRESPPDIAEFLPPEAGALRRMVLIELIKIDLEQRYAGKAESKQVEQYVREFPELMTDNGVPCDLLYEEFYVRRQAGESVAQEEYLERFPDQAESLGRLFGFRSTRMVKRQFVGPESIEIEAGQNLEDFDILNRLGEGAFAKVFLARQKSMQRRVALKVSARESDEPQTMAQLDHANIVRVFDQRHLADRDIQLVYMEYVPGGSLQSVVEKVRRTPPGRRTGALLLEVVDQTLASQGETPPQTVWRQRLSQMPWGEVVCWLGAQLALALDYAHARQTLHRDLKPANVLLTAEGVPKLVDFNMSYSSKLEGASPAAYFGGSVGYMAPEHLEAYSPRHDRRPDELDGRSDLYSLGLVLWELLTGNRPFVDEMIGGDWSATLEAMTARRKEGVAQAAIDQLPKDMPPGLREALLRCLQPEPEKRFAAAGDMARELRLCLHPEVCRARQRRSGTWYQWARHHPVLSSSLLGLLPNFVLSVANVSYDWFAIVRPRLPPGAHVVFLGTLVTLMKTALYAVGLVVAIWFLLPMFRMFWTLPTHSALAKARRLSLSMGDLVFWVSMGAWGVSGVLFPAWINWTADAIETRDYAHFLASHLLCGLIAGTLGFFLTSLLAVRMLFPFLLDQGPVDPGIDASLVSLRGRVTIFSRLAVAVPFLAAVTLGFGDPGFQPAFAGLAVLGGAMLTVTPRFSRDIQTDIDALLAAVSPDVGPFGISTSSLPA